jgi:plasmid stabilization system protein ParE
MQSSIKISSNEFTIDLFEKIKALLNRESEIEITVRDHPLSDTISFSKNAKEDFQKIVDYIAIKNSDSKASLFIKKLVYKITTLKEMPFRYRKSFYHEDVEYRDLIYKGYPVVFRVNEKEIIIFSFFRQR